MDLFLDDNGLRHEKVNSQYVCVGIHLRNITFFSEAVVQRCSVKKGFLEISENSQACNFIKNETLAQVFSCEFC